MSKTIKLAPGIGDNIWLIQKLINTGEKFTFILSGDLPNRGKQVFDLFPQITIKSGYAEEFGKNFSTNLVLDNSAQYFNKKWGDIKEKEIFLAPNRHIEAGKYLKDLFPDLPISYYMDYNTSAEDKNIANKLLPNKNKHYIGIYGSCYAVNRHWGFWLEKEWFNLIRNLKRLDDSVVPVIIGATYDIDLGQNLIRMLKSANIEYVDTIGQSLSSVIEIMKLLFYGFYFPSGLGIISGTLGAPSTMFYPQHLRSIMTKWCDPMLTESGIFKECLFCSDTEIFNWIKDRGIFKND